jgi:hypothetical protein
MRSLRGLVCLGALCAAPFLFAQQRVDPRNLYERIICIVPMTGSGTWADPKRPLFVPALSTPALSRTGLLAYAYVLSDDRTLALVEFVAPKRSAFQPILSANQPGVKIFERGKSTRQDIEQEFRKYKKNFSLSQLEVTAQ